MKILTLLAFLASAIRLTAADSTIGNLTPITTVPSSYRMPWENVGVADFYITFDNLTNQVLAGMSSQAYAITAAHDSTNGFPWLVLSVPSTPMLTNRVFWTNVVALTNSQFQKVDMNIKEGDFQTNAGFAFLGLINKSATNYQSVVVTVFNSTGLDVPILAPANVHTNGALAYNVTNISKVLVEWHPLYGYTNMLVYPLY